MKNLPYREGTWFAIPFGDGKYGAGLVARMAPRGKIILAYFFGLQMNRLPVIADVAALRPDDAIKCIRVGDLGLLNGEWPIIGSADWHRADWPTPAFVRRDDLAKQAWKVIYSDEDPGMVLQEDRISFDTKGLEEAALYGFKAAEIAVRRRLGLS